MIRNTRFAIATIIVAVLLLSLMPIAHAQQGPLEVQANVRYARTDAMGYLIPHFSETPAFGGGVSAKYPIGLSAFSGGINTTMTQMMANSQKSGMPTGNTGIFVKAERHLHPAHLSAQTTYMHTGMEYNVYETILKARLDTAKQKPYVFLGFITPTDIPIEKIFGMGGVGISTYTELHENLALCTDSSIATTILNINGEEKMQKTVLRGKVALETNIQESTKLEMGFNIFQYVQKREYTTWWNVRAIHTF